MRHESVGRPRSSSRDTLEDAALELFLERGYAATTIEQITQRAGVSRNTFFNYFEAKSDLLWLEVDAGIDRLRDELDAVPPGEPPLPALREVIIRVAAEVGADRVPLALTQGEVMGSQGEAVGSGLARFARRADVLAGFLAPRLGAARGELIIVASSNALAGAISAAWQSWARDGISRRPLADYVAEAFDLVVSGVAAAVESVPRRSTSRAR
ncbi:TetR/AcrR family transcriptional regulator [Parafrigoribacterium soli]|uniref:TetR/AcrR family transcriptional regulator n=1 Tax=Parafrigoribacterium soli TaxID=3144663 RepID=UPI0032EB0371